MGILLDLSPQKAKFKHLRREFFAKGFVGFLKGYKIYGYIVPRGVAFFTLAL
jgi:hypothetical protein